MIWTRSASFVLLSLIVIPVFLACGIPQALHETNQQIRGAVDEFDHAIDQLERQSSDWQVVLQNLESSITADIQSTIRVEVRNLAQNTISAAGVEFRCDAEYLRRRTERELRRIRNELVELLNAGGTDSPIALLPELPALPCVCSASPSAIDLNLDPERRAVLDIYGFDFKSSLITAEVVYVDSRRNVTSALGIISDMHMVLDLTEGGAALEDGARSIVLSWDGEAQAVIPILSPPSIQFTCKTALQPVYADQETFTPGLTTGDAEFGGNGPCVRFKLWISISEDGTELKAAWRMTARECDDSDWGEWGDTYASGNGSTILFRVSDPGDRILSFNVDSYFEDQYADEDHEDDIRTFTGTKPVRKLVYVGDTDGDEAGTRTSVEIHFSDITIELQHCELQ